MPRRPISTRLGSALSALAAGAALWSCGGSGGSPTPTPTPTSVSASAAVASSNALAVGLLRHIGSPARNSVFSPYSVGAALAMINAGAAGRTASEINHVLSATTSASVLADSNATLAHDLAASTRAPAGTDAKNAVHLSIGNSLWLQSGFSVKSPFSHTLTRDFAAPARQLDFQGNPESSRGTINDWVQQHTAGRIKNLMPRNTITAQTKLVLANAVYLKARWQNEFDPNGTSPGPFFTGSGTKVSAKFMALPRTPLRFARTPSFEAVELPYAHSSLSMLVVMPPRGALPRFESGLSAASLSAIERSLGSGEVRLQMPKFHLVAHVDLVSTLSALGMPVAFSDSADFSGITNQPPLKIGTVQHGADLAVDERGTVAAAATGVSAVATAVAPLPATHLTIDHPFLLLLRDEKTGAILFAGRVNNPTTS